MIIHQILKFYNLKFFYNIKYCHCYYNDSNKFKIKPSEHILDVTGGRNGVFFILENGDEERVTMNSFATTEDLYCHVLFKINL